MFRLVIISIVFAIVSPSFTFSLWPLNIGWSRIVGGQDAEQPIPYMASIAYYGSHHCGAAIINERTILTAAHCLYGLNKRLAKVRVGSKYKYSGYLIPVADWKIHENFDTSTMDYDIGVIFLDEDIPMIDGEIEPIAMAEYKTEIPDGTKGTISGWGFLEANGPEPAILQVASVPIVNYKICFDQMKGRITTRMICAGYKEGGVDACQMDSGGPLVAQKKLVGIVSWGDGCAKPERPGIYAKVSELRDWIDDQINKVNLILRRKFN